MARAAGQFLLHKNITSIEQIIWQAPLFVEDTAVLIQVELFPKNDTDYRYKICSLDPDNKEVLQLHSQGILSTKTLPIQVNIDPADIENKIKHPIDGKDLYTCLDRMGYNYGPRFQGVTQCCKNQQEIIARVCLAEFSEQEKRDFVLHPAALDSSLHASAMLGLSETNQELRLSAIATQQETTIPFSLNEVQIYAPLPHEFYVRLQECNNGTKNITKINADLRDYNGNLLVALRGFCSRKYQEQQITDNQKSKLFYYTPSWNPKEIPVGEHAEDYANYYLLPETFIDLQQSLCQSYPDKMTRLLYLEEPFNPELVTKNFLQITKVLKGFASVKQPILMLACLPMHQEHQASWLFGLLESANNDIAHFSYRVISADLAQNDPQWIKIIEKESRHIGKEKRVRYSKGLHRKIFVLLRKTQKIIFNNNSY